MNGDYPNGSGYPLPPPANGHNGGKRIEDRLRAAELSIAQLQISLQHCATKEDIAEVKTLIAEVKTLIAAGETSIIKREADMQRWLIRLVSIAVSISTAAISVVISVVIMLLKD